MTSAGPRPEDAALDVVVVDRDGTLIDFYRDEELGVVTPAFHPDHVRFLPGAIEGLARLRDAGFAIAIATNQPGPAKGQIGVAAVERVNAAIVATLGARGIQIEAFEVCMHHPEGGEGGVAELVRACECRKPAPGMLQAIAARLHAAPARSWMIGDTDTDVRAARAAGFRAALVHRAGRCEICPLPQRDRAALPVAAPPLPDVRGATLLEIADAILRR